ncbi:hypothetical protein HPB50_012789 [Hyalomma asiaticum]|uniref:Uncharacterized protein n=1 Tax=Hyalomma asiaticum TaxID=266040 RepID=A0ACB7SE10_HYAAI|nr:hypothetical protein HPB50_012789 [Hyalomma asiaticum]
MEDHNHQLNCADGLRRLRSSSNTRSTFHSYFKDGLAPAEALHQQKLAVEDDGVEQLANGALNPSANTVYHLFRVWHKDHYGDAVEPLSKLEEKAPLYLQNAFARPTKSRDGNCWTVLVVTKIMQRTQSLESASEIIFLDSTASCDESQATVTVALPATPVGALPVAVLMHNSQTTESYKTAFGLLKQKYPHCFGGLHTPQSFMTDNSAAEKAALQAVWPEATQLLCHFHVAQAEWRWLHASSNKISRDERRELMTAFQKLMNLHQRSIPAAMAIARANRISGCRLPSNAEMKKDGALADAGKDSLLPEERQLMQVDYSYSEALREVSRLQVCPSPQQSLLIDARQPTSSKT